MGMTMNPGITTCCQVRWLSYHCEEVMPELGNLLIDFGWRSAPNTLIKSSGSTIRESTTMVHTKDTLGWLPALTFEASDNSKKYRIDLQHELIEQYHSM